MRSSASISAFSSTRRSSSDFLISTEAGGEGSHDDRPEAEAAGLDDGIARAQCGDTRAVVAEVPGRYQILIFERTQGDFSNSSVGHVHGVGKIRVHFLGGEDITVGLVRILFEQQVRRPLVGVAGPPTDTAPAIARSS